MKKLIFLVTFLLLAQTTLAAQIVPTLQDLPQQTVDNQEEVFVEHSAETVKQLYNANYQLISSGEPNITGWDISIYIVTIAVLVFAFVGMKFMFGWEMEEKLPSSNVFL